MLTANNCCKENTLENFVANSVIGCKRTSNDLTQLNESTSLFKKLVYDGNENRQLTMCAHIHFMWRVKKIIST